MFSYHFFPIQIFNVFFRYWYVGGICLFKNTGRRENSSGTAAKSSNVDQVRIKKHLLFSLEKKKRSMFWLCLLSCNLLDSKFVMPLNLNLRSWLRSSNKAMSFSFWVSYSSVNSFGGFFNFELLLLQNFIFKCGICFRMIHIKAITVSLFQPDAVCGNSLNNLGISARCC